MTILSYPATGKGVFGIKRHVKSSLQRGVRATSRCGLGLSARMRMLSEYEKPPSTRVEGGYCPWSGKRQTVGF